MPHPHRIACVFEHPTLSGGERSMLEVLRRLSGRDFEFQALAPPRGRLWEALQSLGIECVPFKRSRVPEGSRVPAELSAEALSRVVRADLVHGNSLSTAQFTGLAGERLGVPALAHVREIETLNPTRVGRIAKNQSLVAVSSAVRRHLLEEGLAADLVEIVYNGVDLERLRPDRVAGTIRAELGIPRRAPLVAAVGQISLRKASDLLIEVVSELARADPELHALVVGERFSQKSETIELEEHLREQVGREGIDARVHFLGWRDDVPGILRDLDLLMHPAREEPLGRVLIEAAALGVPCVATAVGGSPEIIDDGRTGWLVPANDPAALVERTAWALKHPEERARAGVAARQRAERMFSGAECARKTASLYRRLLGSA